jgi:hypothetical protein
MNTVMRLFLAIAAAAVLSNALCASDGVAEKSTSGNHPNPQTKAPADVPKYALKNKSAFTLSPETRAPFWPIGWVKRSTPRGEIRERPNITINESAFSVTSILMGSPSLAVINGRAYSEGELVRMPKAGAAQRVRVQSINDGSVTLQCEDQTLVVALRRPELAERRPEVDLLDPNR